MTDFLRGQKGKLADIGCTGAFRVILNIAAPGISVDIACFGLDAGGQLSDDRYMVFYNQKTSPNAAIALENNGNTSIFSTDISRLPDSIHKLVFVASIDGDGSMSRLGSSAMSLGTATFPFSGSDFQNEKAVIIGEIYKRDGIWRFGAVGQGFDGGLSALLKHFGGTEATSPSATTAPTQAPAAENKKISLSKVTLEKRGDKVSLQKTGTQGFGRIRVNLNWNRNTVAAPKPGFLNKLMGNNTSNSSSIDLDLGCYFQLRDGQQGGIQALGNSWGSFDQLPYIHLDGDDRSGNNVGGENLFINGKHFDSIQRILIFSFIYDGVPNWGATDAVVTIEVPGQGPVEVRLDNGTNASMCAIAMIENQGGNIQVTKLVEYFEQTGQKSTHELINDRYRFSLRFKEGSKD